MNQKDGKTIVPPSKWIPNALFQEIQKNIPIPCIDLLPVRKTKDGKIEVLLIKRKIYPEQGKWGLIGGRILKNELTKEAIKRQAKEELGVSVKIIPPWTEINPFAVFNDPVSDKQKHFVALTYPVSIIKGKIKTSGPEFSEARWFSLRKLPKLFTFHHKKVVSVFKNYITTHSFSII
jgi:ADP-ribose pyrophosphatase YjhB (NUDIX family)